jgi:glycosyltransferase involved in cell wall biosynthesis
MRLIVYSGVHHHTDHGQIVAHGGFVREMELWARLFDRVLIVAPLTETKLKADDKPYEESNIEFFAISSAFDSNGLSGKVRLIRMLPGLLKRANSVIQSDDVIMARGPDSIGFLGYLLTRFKKNKRFAKYADQWQNFSGEPFGYRLQKLFYRSKSFGGLVQIYGDADPKRPHLVPFFTSSITEDQWVDAGTRIQHVTRPHEPLRCLFVGRLVYAKGVDVIINSVSRCQKDGLNIALTIVGDGPERERLESKVEKFGLKKVVRFTGNLGWNSLAEIYSSSDVFIQASRKEGFGKVLTEAMTFALPIIGTDVGVTKEILEPPDYGITIQSADEIAQYSMIKECYLNYEKYKSIGAKARLKSHQYILENLENRYLTFLREIV